MNIEIIGFIAAIITTTAYLPQVYKIWKTKKTDGVSLIMYIVMFCGISLWLYYSLVINRPSLIVANSVTLIVISMIIFFKIKFK